jgi:XTP/dITP diphosphohydrolase
VRQILVATTNPDKLREIRQVLAGLPVQLLGLDRIPPTGEPEESGATFQENARLKALHYGAHTPLLTVAEDSGLVIDALDGEPGVHSARWLRSDASYPERFAEIHRRLARLPDAARTARFVCAVALAQSGTIVFETTAAVEGEIAPRASGTAGFGYDPIFHYPPFGRTLAEVSREQKLLVAHRGRAFRHLAQWLRENPERGTGNQHAGS